MRVYVRQHQHKANGLIRAVDTCGCKLVRKGADVALFDHGNGLHGDGMQAVAERMWEKGATIVIYPHAAAPPWWYDGVWTLDERIAAILVTTETHREIVAGWGLGCEVHAIGWSYCEQKFFQLVEQVRKVLFAPIHPPMNGTLRDEAFEANRQAMVALQGMLPEVEVTVRHIHGLDRQGLWRHPGMTYIQGQPNGSISEIDEADLVVCEGTFMHLAVARGKPVIGLNQHHPVRPNNVVRGMAEHWDEYGHLLSYPLDMSDGPLPELMEQARQVEQTEWRRRNVGENLDPWVLQQVLEGIRERDLARRKGEIASSPFGLPRNDKNL